MRTEQLLREALAALADQPHQTETVRQHILRRTSPPSRGARRAVLVGVLVAVIVLVVTVPTLVSRRSAEPADTRVPGNWSMVHRVDLPPGWTVATQTVTADTESTSLRGPASTGDPPAGCLVQVRGPGQDDPLATAPRREKVEVGGRPGFYSYPSEGGTAASPQPNDDAVTWMYAVDAWAEVSCGSRAEDLQLAGRVRFETVPTRLPFRLRKLPDGYEVRAVTPPVLNADTTTFGAVELVTTVFDAGPVLDITMSPGSSEVPLGRQGWTTMTVDGLPAVLSPDGRLCLNTHNDSLCVGSGGERPADRDLLVGVAEQLTLTKHLDEPSTWFDANRTLP